MDVLSLKHPGSSCHSGMACVIHSIHRYGISKKYNTRVIYYNVHDTTINATTCYVVAEDYMATCFDHKVVIFMIV